MKCEGCDYFDGEGCVCMTQCPARQKGFTHYDRIRNMSVHEMAIFLCKVGIIDACTVQQWEQWLKSETE